MKRVLSTLVLGFGLGGWLADAQDKDMRTIASTIADALVKAHKKTVAVVDFTDLQGNVTELGRYLAEQMSVALAMTDKGIEVVDRTHLKAIVQENKLSASGIIDPSTARKLGQITGVEVLVTGTLTPFGDSVQLSVKALDAATARIVGASTVDVAKTKAIEDLLNRGIAGGVGVADVQRTTVPLSSGLPASSQQQVGNASAGQTKQVGLLEITVKGCRIRPDGILCEAILRNLDEERQYCLFDSLAGGGTSRIIDQQGNVFIPTGSQIGEAGVGSYPCAKLPSHVRVRSSIFVRHDFVEGTRLSLVEFLFALDPNRRTPVQFLDVPVTR